MIDLSADRHTHSSVTDGEAGPRAMAEAARAAGLTTWGLSDHVRADTSWLPEYEWMTRELRVEGLAIECGVEVKILDASGRLDLPGRVPALDYILIADHRFPGWSGPEHPDAVRARIRAGRLAADVAVEQIVLATCSAIMRSPRPAIVVHPFSLLPKCGLSEEYVTDQLLDELAVACRAVEARVEIDERWRCPSARVAAGLDARGVRLCAGSGAHRPQDVGAWSYVSEILAAPLASQ